MSIENNIPEEEMDEETSPISFFQKTYPLNLSIQIK